jgi:hypothetical protein
MVQTTLAHSADITQPGTYPIGLPALVVAVIIVVPERFAEAKASEATMVRKPLTGAAEAMTAEPSSHAAPEVRAAHAGAQMSTTDAAAEVAAAHAATKVPPSHSATEVAPAHSPAKMAATTAATSTTATARQSVGRDASTSHRHSGCNDRDFVQRKFPHDSFLSFI